jgi:hypothetical protein
MTLTAPQLFFGGVTSDDTFCLNAHAQARVYVSITRRERLVCLSYESMGEGATSAGATGEWLDGRGESVLCVCCV